MHPEFWKSRWQEGKIGFHRDTPNPHLVRYAPTLAGWPGRGFLPLCGKSVDLPWLARQGVPAVGNELVPTAVQQFILEQGEAVELRETGALRTHTVRVPDAEAPVELIEGDFFSLTPDVLGPVDWVFDRAAMIALPPERRGDYVAHLRRLVESARAILLVTLEYPAGTMSGPPFSVGADEVARHYAGLEPERLAHRDVLASYPHLSQAGLPALWESVWRVDLRP